MNYRKMVNSKRAMKEFAQNVKSSVVDGSKKVQEFAGTHASDFVENAKTAMNDIKDSISVSMKDKLANEFRKNYHSYAIDYVDKLIVEATSAGMSVIEIVKFDSDCGENQYSVNEIMEKIADGMIDEDMLRAYTRGNMIEGLYDFLVAYYENEPQLKVVAMRSLMTISLPSVAINVEDEEETVDSDTDTVEDETKENSEE